MLRIDEIIHHETAERHERNRQQATHLGVGYAVLPVVLGKGLLDFRIVVHNAGIGFLTSRNTLQPVLSAVTLQSSLLAPAGIRLLNCGPVLSMRHHSKM